MKRIPRIAAVALFLSLPGCYHYVPEAGRALTQGTPVRIRLQTPQSFELASMTVHNVGAVTAEMIREENDEVVVSTLWLDALAGPGFSGENWTYRIARGNIASLEIRTLSAWRTFAVVAGVFLATYVGFDALQGSDAGTGGSGNGGVPR